MAHKVSNGIYLKGSDITMLPLQSFCLGRAIKKMRNYTV